MNLAMDDLAPSRKSLAAVVVAFAAVLAIFGFVLVTVLARQADTADALDDLEEDVADVELLVSPLVFAPGGRFESALIADRENNFVHVSGATCFREGVTLAIVRVQIRWSWVAEVPQGMRVFYNEDGGSTQYGAGRLVLDENNCFTFQDFPQPFPELLVRDLERNPDAEGEMNVTFTLTPSDMSNAEQPVAGLETFVFSGPFLIQAVE